MSTIKQIYPSEFVLWDAGGRDLNKNLDIISVSFQKKSKKKLRLCLLPVMFKNFLWIYSRNFTICIYFK